MTGQDLLARIKKINLELHLMPENLGKGKNKLAERLRFFDFYLLLLSFFLFRGKRKQPFFLQCTKIEASYLKIKSSRKLTCFE